MSRILAGLSAVCMLVGMAMAIAPSSILGAIDWTSPTGQRVAAPLRIAFGVLLWASASKSRFPRIIRGFGALIAAAGVVILFLPADTWRTLTEAILVRPPVPLRIMGSLPNFALAAALFYAARPRPSDLTQA
jgi:hypothetical protein